MKVKIDQNTLDKIKEQYSAKYLDDSLLYKSKPYDTSVLDDKTTADVYSLYEIMEEKHPDTFERLPDTSPNVRMYAVDDDGRKPIAMIVGGIHGDEKSSVYGVAYAVNAILNSSTFSHLRENFTIVVVPCLNPTGFDACKRTSSDDVDLNRDWGDFRKEECRGVDNYIKNHRDRIRIILDSHNCGRNNDYYPFSVVAPDDAPFYKLYEDVQLKIRFFMEDTSKDVIPISIIPSPNKNTFSEYINRNGFIGHTLETPRCIEDMGDQRNYKQGCEVTKDLVLNLILIYNAVVVAATKNIYL